MSTSAPRPLDVRQKELGAHYTPPALAELLVRWAVRTPFDSVLDPSFGSLAFLEATAERLRSLGTPEARLREQIHGVDVDQEAFTASIPTWPAGPRASLVHADFLGLRPGDRVPIVDALVGNPPYLRYQGFNARSGCISGLTAAAAAVPLSRQASSWASFLIHAVRFVAPGGRLTHVLPAQLIHAQYASVVREFLAREFARVVVIGVEERVFPTAQEEIVLVFADGRGDGPSSLEFASVPNLSDLDLDRVFRESRVPKRCAGEHREKLLTELLEPQTRRLYNRLARSAATDRLGEIGDVHIGTVTGANSFFVLSQAQAAKFDNSLLVPIVGKAAHIPGARLTRRDFETIRDAGGQTQLLLIDEATSPQALLTVESYLRDGEVLGLHRRNKCRSRNPWWSVKPPRRPVADLLLTYCAHAHPRLSVNEAKVMNTNTIHGVFVRRGVRRRALASGFHNSLTMLSAELLARSYGGGVLKLEPTEAEALLIPPLEFVPSSVSFLKTVDALIRDGDLESALDAVDRHALIEGLGLRRRDVLALRRGAQKLRGRRHLRSKHPRTAP